MGKRSDFKRVEKDFYQTFDQRAYPPLMAHLKGTETFAEPCAGHGDMVEALGKRGLKCRYMGDIQGVHPITKKDALQITERDIAECDLIITNPPWSRDILHEMILKFQSMRPTWLLFDSNWTNSKRAAPYMKNLKKIVPVGRLQWMKNTKYSAKDDVSWYLFEKSWHAGYSQFYPRQQDT